MLVFWSLKLPFEDFYNFLLLILVGKSCNYREYKLRLERAAKFQKEYDYKRYVDRKKFSITEVQFSYKVYWQKTRFLLGKILDEMWV